MFSGMEAVGGGLFHLFIIDPIGQKRCHFERFGSHNHINADKSLWKTFTHFHLYLYKVGLLALVMKSPFEMRILQLKVTFIQ